MGLLVVVSDLESSDPDLGYLLAEEQLPRATTDRLQAVLKRHRRRHLHLLSGAVVISLVAVSVGVLAGGGFGGSGARVQVGAGPTAPSAPTGSSSSAYASQAQLSTLRPYQHLFVRTTSAGVDVRAFVQTTLPPELQLPPACAAGSGSSRQSGWTGYSPLSSSSPPAGSAASSSSSAGPSSARSSTSSEPRPDTAKAAAASAAAASAAASAGAPNCMPRQVRQHLLACMPKFPSKLLYAELSNKAMVGMAVLPLGGNNSTGSLEGVSTSIIGVPEGSPVAVVDVRAGPGVARAVAVFSGGKSDSMAPVGGFAVLAAPVPASSSPYSGQSIGTLQLLSANGAVVAKRTLRQGTFPTFAPPGSQSSSASCGGSVAPMVSAGSAIAYSTQSKPPTTANTANSTKAP